MTPAERCRYLRQEYFRERNLRWRRWAYRKRKKHHQH